MNAEECPNCGGEELQTIVYGLLRDMSESEREEFKKKYISGGCNIDDDSPKYHCVSCGHEFGSQTQFTEIYFGVRLSEEQKAKLRKREAKS